MPMLHPVLGVPLNWNSRDTRLLNALWRRTRGEWFSTKEIELDAELLDCLGKKEAGSKVLGIALVRLMGDYPVVFNVECRKLTKRKVVRYRLVRAFVGPMLD